ANTVGAPLDLKAFDGSGLKPDGSAYESDVLRETLFPDFKSFGPLNGLFVSHDAHPHGAQKLLLTLTSWLKEKGLVNPRFLLAGSGPLYDEFLSIGPAVEGRADVQQKCAANGTLRL